MQLAGELSKGVCYILGKWCVLACTMVEGDEVCSVESVSQKRVLGVWGVVGKFGGTNGVIRRGSLVYLIVLPLGHLLPPSLPSA